MHKKQCRTLMSAHRAAPSAPSGGAFPQPFPPPLRRTPGSPTGHRFAAVVHSRRTPSMAYSFAPRLRLAPLWPALAALALAAVLASILLPRTLAQQATSQLAQEARLLVAAVPAPASLTSPDPVLAQRLHQLVAGTDFRITLVALDGTVLADSERLGERARGHGQPSHAPRDRSPRWPAARAARSATATPPGRTRSTPRDWSTTAAAAPGSCASGNRSPRSPP